ncbi:hypothetical protein BLOT_006666 [Blomia tropicalis]|nr:hypothetical protein BLOT_006666 [Blomia tropicalis]
MKDFQLFTVSWVDYLLLMAIPIIVCLALIAYMYNNTIGLEEQCIRDWQSLTHFCRTRDRHSSDSEPSYRKLKSKQGSSEGFSIGQASQQTGSS